MKPSLLSLGVLSLCLVPALSPLRAQDVEFSMPRAQVVRLGLDKFLPIYQATTHDDSNQGYAAGCQYFEESKRADNDSRAKKLTLKRRAQFNSTRSVLVGLGESSLSMGILSSGGGSIWRGIGAYASAQREEFLGKLASTLSLPASRARSERRQASALMLQSERKLQQLQSPANVQKIEGFDAERTVQARRSYRQELVRTRAVLHRLRSLVSALPDVAARQVAERAVHEMGFATDSAT